MASLAYVEPKPITVAQFLSDYCERSDGRWELIEGVPVMMAGGTVRHARVAGRLLAALYGKLRGSGCEPFNSDMLLRTGERTLRLPDVAIYCDPRDIAGDDQTRILMFPKILFEVLSPSTQRDDRGRKLFEYQQIESVRVVVLIDADKRVIHVFTPETEGDWRHRKLAPGEALTIAEPAFTLTTDEIFGPA